MSKLTDAEAEAAETQTWLDFASECDYLSEDVKQELRQNYDRVIGKLVNMIYKPSPWLLSKRDVKL